MGSSIYELDKELKDKYMRRIKLRNNDFICRRKIGLNIYIAALIIGGMVFLAFLATLYFKLIMIGIIAGLAVGGLIAYIGWFIIRYYGNKYTKPFSDRSQEVLEIEESRVRFRYSIRLLWISNEYEYVIHNKDIKLVEYSDETGILNIKGNGKIIDIKGDKTEVDNFEILLGAHEDRGGAIGKLIKFVG